MMILGAPTLKVNIKVFDNTKFTSSSALTIMRVNQEIATFLKDTAYEELTLAVSCNVKNVRALDDYFDALIDLTSNLKAKMRYPEDIDYFDSAVALGELRKLSKVDTLNNAMRKITISTHINWFNVGFYTEGKGINRVLCARVLPFSELQGGF